MANVNGTEIDLTPTEGMKTEAERYRKWKSEGEAGGTEGAQGSHCFFEEVLEEEGKH